VEEKASGALVGRIGLWRPEGWPELELVWGLLRDHHGKGYATEAARCARDHAFEAMGVDTLVSYIHPDNEPSKRVAERLGARLEQTIELFGEPAGVYRHIAA
jgi:RimJ/RimL family protein N-acetyltransferase